MAIIQRRSENDPLLSVPEKVFTPIRERVSSDMQKEITITQSLPMECKYCGRELSTIDEKAVALCGRCISVNLQEHEEALKSHKKPIKPLPTPTDPLCLKRKCKRCSGEYLPSGQNQKYCPDCKENDMKVRKAVKKIQKLTPMTPRETTAIGPVVDAALELVRRCTELGISHAVQLNISGTKLTIERG